MSPQVCLSQDKIQEARSADHVQTEDSPQVNK